MGAATEATGRQSFSDFLRKLLDGLVDRKADRCELKEGGGREARGRIRGQVDEAEVGRQACMG